MLQENRGRLASSQMLPFGIKPLALDQRVLVHGFPHLCGKYLENSARTRSPHEEQGFHVRHFPPQIPVIRMSA